MNMPVKVCKIDRTSWEFFKSLDSRAPAKWAMNSLVDLQSDAESLQMPCVPLTDQQMQDYRALMTKVDALLALDRHQEAKRVKLVASNILRTGAPALE